MQWPPEHTYFIADIGANHDGDLARAIHLIRLAASVGCDAAKFQHFRAEHIVSRDMKAGAHQAGWGRSVYETYDAASVPWDWTPILKAECDSMGLDFLSTPYDLEAVDHLDNYVPAFKIGSGDITWHELIRHAASKGKPIILSTGASTVDEVVDAVVAADGVPLAILQCNTSYTGRRENLKHANVRVLESYRAAFPDAVLGLSDHTANYTAVLGAVLLGARIIEKHFTDDPTRPGPDHAFAMDPHIWHDVIERSREIVWAMGDPVKRVAPNEEETVVLQRRAVRAARELPRGTVLSREDVVVLRPCPPGAIGANQVGKVVGMQLARTVPAGEALTWAQGTWAMGADGMRRVGRY